jgi:hypothetical protein
MPSAFRAALLAPLFLCSTSFPLFEDSTLGVTQIVSSLPETSARYLGSPSLLPLPSGAWLASHDWFGAGAGALIGTTRVLISRGGGPFSPVGNASGMYWATLFSRPGDAAAYLLGTSGDEGGHASIRIARSADEGATWTSATLVADARAGFSTGPTPVLLAGGRLWRAFEHNVGAWASGYAAVALSAAADAPDLLAPGAWALSGELPFSAVAPLVPAAWAAAPPPFSVRPAFGWLEGNAVARDDGGAGIYILLRVNSAPAANKAALLALGAPGGAPTFKGWVEPFWGGNSKFSVKRDAATGLYVTLATWVPEPAAVSLPPSCGPVVLPPGGAPLPCCGFFEACGAAGGANGTPAHASCVWCHANSRNRLSLSVARAAGGPWALAGPPLLLDDTGVPAFVSEMGTGFQYVDWVFSGADIVASVRAGYRGSNNCKCGSAHAKLRAQRTPQLPTPRRRAKP